MKTLAFLFVAASLVATGAQAQNAARLQSLVGARGSSGESELNSRGYQFISSGPAKGGKHAFWWSQSAQSCVRVTTRDGRYSNIIDRPALFCGKSASAGGSGSAAVAPVALHDIQGMRGVLAFDAMRERGAWVAASIPELQSQLRDFLSGKSVGHRGTVTRSQDATIPTEEAAALRQHEGAVQSAALAALWVQGADIDWTAIEPFRLDPPIA